MRGTAAGGSLFVQWKVAACTEVLEPHLLCLGGLCTPALAAGRLGSQVPGTQSHGAAAGLLPICACTHTCFTFPLYACAGGTACLGGTHCRRCLPLPCACTPAQAGRAFRLRIHGNAARTQISFSSFGARTLPADLKLQEHTTPPCGCLLQVAWERTLCYSSPATFCLPPALPA